MALNAAVYSHDLFGYMYKDFQCSNNPLSYCEFSTLSPCEGQQEANNGFLGVNNNWAESSPEAAQMTVEKGQVVAVGGQRKRRRTRSSKNKEEMENQRMTHIEVERNRRKQMNEYLGIIRSLMPELYVQRGDQASIIGGAINYVKELEHLLQTLEAQKQTATVQTIYPPLFSSFFTFPQYTLSYDSALTESASRAGLADIEVSMAESHASLKVLTCKRPKQLLKLVAGLQSHRLTILHLNVTTVDQRIFYSLSAKIEEGCPLTTVEEIAEAINQLLSRIQQEATSS